MTHVSYISKRPLMMGAEHTDNFVSQTELAVDERTAYNGRAYILTYTKEVPTDVARDLEILKLLDDSEVESLTDEAAKDIGENFELLHIAPFAHSESTSDRLKAYNYMMNNYIPRFLKAWGWFLTPTQFANVQQGMKTKLNVA